MDNASLRPLEGICRIDGLIEMLLRSSLSSLRAGKPCNARVERSPSDLFANDRLHFWLWRASQPTPDGLRVPGGKVEVEFRYPSEEVPLDVDFRKPLI